MVASNTNGNAASNGSYTATMKPSPAFPSDDLESLSTYLGGRIGTYLSRISAAGATQPTLAEPFPDPVKDNEAQNAKVDIVRACERIMALVLGPMEWGMMNNMSFVDPACVSTMLELKIPELIAPGSQPTSLDQLVKLTGASKDILKRVMRVCTQRLYFDEVAPEQFVHNGPSMTLLAPPISALIAHCCDEGLKSAARMTDALRDTSFQGSDDPTKCAFSKAFQTEKGLFDYFYSDDLDRAQRFGLGMAGTEVIKALTEDIFPFDTLPHRAKVVDVGGGRGQVSVRIAEKMPDMSFVVQDDEAILEAGQAEGVPEEVKDRIEWMPHDFTEDQPVKGADVYLFRFILHDHPDSKCIKILSKIVEAMDPEKSRILIDDAVIPDTLGHESSRFFNSLDLYMMMLLNSKERTESQWRELVSTVSEKLVINKVWKEIGGGPNGGAVLELKLRQE